MTLRARVARLLHAAPPLPVLLGAWAIVLASAWPGQMSIDTHAQLRQGREGVYDDIYPPTHAALWGLIDRLVAGPAGLFVLQTALFTFGIHRLARTTLGPSVAAWVTAAVIVFPPVLAPMRCVWSDAVMAGGLMAGFALVHAAGAGRRGAAAMVIGAGVLVVATAMRHNGFVAMAPLAVVAFAGRSPSTWSRWRRVVAGGVAALAIAAAATALNRGLTDRHVYVWHERNAPMDVVGGLRHGPARSDDELRARLVGLRPGGPDLGARIAEAPRWTWWWITHGERRVIDPPETPAERAAIERAFVRGLRDEPLAYVQHRAIVFAAVLGLATWPPRPAYETRALPEDVPASFTVREGHVERVVTDVVSRLAYTPLFLPVLYFLGALVGLVLVWRRGREPIFVALLTSGLVYELALFVIAPSHDYRYSHWMITCVTTVAVVRLARGLRAPS